MMMIEPKPGQNSIAGQRGGEDAGGVISKLPIYMALVL